MFGKKKKQAQLEAEQRLEEEKKLQEQLSSQPEPEAPIVEEEEEPIEEVEDNSLPQEYESIAYILKQEMGDDLMALPALEDEEGDSDAPQIQEELLEEHPEPVEQDVEEEVDKVDSVEQVEEQEEEVCIVEDVQEEEEEIQPAKLSQLSNLVDYILSQNMSKKMKINIANLLLGAYTEYKDIPVERHIVVQCMAKVMHSIMQEVQDK